MNRTPLLALCLSLPVACGPSGPPASSSTPAASSPTAEVTPPGSPTPAPTPTREHTPTWDPNHIPPEPTHHTPTSTPATPTPVHTPTPEGCVDEDHDTFCAGPDCNDADAGIHPRAIDGCDGVDQDCDGIADDVLGVAVSFDSRFPTVPRFNIPFPTGGTAARILVDEPGWSHTFTLPNPAPGAVKWSFPLTPQVKVDWRVEVDTPTGRCTDKGSFNTGAHPEADVPQLGSTATGPMSSGKDYLIVPGSLYPGPDISDTGYVFLLDELGRTLWSMPLNYNIRTAHMDERGRGLWTFQQTDGTYGEEMPPVGLDLWSWEGRVLEHYDVPSGHHDWAFAPGQRQVNSLGDEHFTSLEEQCGYTVWGDTIFEADLDTGDVTTLFSAADDGFPTSQGCVEIPQGFSYSYLNGVERHGDTLAASASAAVWAFVIGMSDGIWYILTNTPETDLTVVRDGADLQETLLQTPHSVLCTEETAWGQGSAWPGVDAVCLGFNRRGGEAADGECDTVDLFWIDRDTAKAHYVASWPPASEQSNETPGCLTTFSHGDVSLIGAPNRDGDGETRLAMFSSNSGKLDVLTLTITPSSVKLEPTYFLSPETPRAMAGWFMDATDRIGAGHHVVSR